MNRTRMKKRMGLCLCLVFIPLTVLAGALLLEQNRYDIVMLLVAVLSIVPFFLRFEHKRQNVRELVLVAVITAPCPRPSEWRPLSFCACSRI